jgi:TRAP-type C4-dicarboxylate transport system permease small subunit
MRRSIGSIFIVCFTIVLHVVAVLALITMMMVVVANIVGRIFFESPVMGTLEIAGFGGVIMATIAVIFSERGYRNIRVDIIVKHLPARPRNILDGITYFLSLCAMGILLWSVTMYSFEWLRTGEATFTLGIRHFPFGFIWAGGLFCLCVLLLKHMIQMIIGRVGK